MPACAVHQHDDKIVFAILWNFFQEQVRHIGVCIRELRPLIKRYDELLETANPKIPFVFQGLSLACVAHDEKRLGRTQEYSSASQVERCRDVLTGIMSVPLAVENSARLSEG